ncbi:MAG: DNA primase [Pyrinomonadaceae bacterium]|nr:DNA primase [Phycisphaerales bacterium]
MQMNDDRQRVLDATDLVRLVGEHVTLKAKGREYLGLCPFHDDHKPSMYVIPSKQIYHCFSCGAGGNAFTFVMAFHKMGFRDAIEYLAERGNVTLTPWTPQRGGVAGVGEMAGEDSTTVPRSALLRANLAARDFFRALLNHGEHGKGAREMIASRGISPEMVEAFELGAAADRWDGLFQTFQKKGMDASPLLQLGLLKSRESGSGVYDAFRNRLIFPIHDQIGRVIGFGGRRLREKNPDGTNSEEAKYLNSAESMVFNKSTTLYGMHQAAQEIRRSRTTIVTEGYMDTIACHQAGIRNAVAALGTALTPANARILRRLCETVVLLFDGDEAGQKATDRAMEALFAEPIDVKIAVMPKAYGAKDPDELLKQPGGVEKFNTMIASATDAMEYRFGRLRQRLSGMGLAAQTRAIEEDLAKLVDLGLPNVEPIRQRLIVKRIASLLRIDEETVLRSIPKRRKPMAAATGTNTGAGDGQSPSAWPLAAPNVPRSITEHLIGCVLCDGSLLLSLQGEDRTLLSPDSMEEGVAQRIAVVIAEITARGGSPDLRSVLLELTDSQAVSCATAWQREIERLTQQSSEVLHQHWRERVSAAGREVRERALHRMLNTPAEAPIISEDDWSHQMEAEPDPLSGNLFNIRASRNQDVWDPTRVPKGLSG